MSFGPHPFPSTIFLDRRYLLPFDNAHSTVDPQKSVAANFFFIQYGRIPTLSLLRIPPIHSFYCHVLYRAGCFCFDVGFLLFLT